MRTVKMTKWMSRFGIVVFALIVLLFWSRPVLAFGNYTWTFENPSGTDWMCEVHASACGLANPSHVHGGAGSLIVNAGNGNQSQLFVVGDNTSTVYYWAYSGNANVGVRIWDWTTPAADGHSDCTIMVNTWTQCGVSLSGYAGHLVSLSLYGSDWVWFDDVQASNVQVVPAYSDTNFINGNFTGSLYGWNEYASNGVFVPSVGHNSLGSASFQSGESYPLYSMPFVGGQQYTAWINNYTCSGCSNHRVTVQVIDWTAGLDRAMLTGYVYANSGSWESFPIDLSTYANHIITLAFLGTGIYFDDFCNASGCSAGTPTATPTLTPTPGAGVTAFPYSYGTPVPVVATIDWSQFPTSAPYPTFPPFPSPVYGVGTPVPVNINGGSPIPVYLTTPFPTQQPYPTAIYGAGTPMPFYNAATATATSYAPTPQVATAVAEVFPTIDTTGHDIQFATSGSNTTNPFAINIADQKFQFTQSALPFVNGGSGSVTYILHIMYPSSFTFANVDLLPGLKGLAAAFVAVFILRNLQAK